MNIRTYSELITLPTFEERFEYLKIGGRVGVDTFGSHRYLNQLLYRSYEWRQFRNEVILRDLGRDLGVEGYEIKDTRILHVHHIDPITVEDVLNRDSKIFDLDNVITTTDRTHKAIHYSTTITALPKERTPYDTCPWKLNRR